MAILSAVVIGHRQEKLKAGSAKLSRFRWATLRASRAFILVGCGPQSASGGQARRSTAPSWLITSHGVDLASCAQQFSQSHRAPPATRSHPENRSHIWVHHGCILATIIATPQLREQGKCFSGSGLPSWCSDSALDDIDDGCDVDHHCRKASLSDGKCALRKKSYSPVGTRKDPRPETALTDVARLYAMQPQCQATQLDVPNDAGVQPSNLVQYRVTRHSIPHQNGQHRWTSLCGRDDVENARSLHHDLSERLLVVQLVPHALHSPP